MIADLESSSDDYDSTSGKNDIDYTPFVDDSIILLIVHSLIEISNM